MQMLNDAAEYWDSLNFTVEGGAALTEGNQFRVGGELAGSKLEIGGGSFEYLASIKGSLQTQSDALPSANTPDDVYFKIQRNSGLTSNESQTLEYGELDRLAFVLGSSEEMQYVQNTTNGEIEGTYTQTLTMVLFEKSTTFYFRIDECGEVCTTSDPTDAYKFVVGFDFAFFYGAQGNASVGFDQNRIKEGEFNRR